MPSAKDPGHDRDADSLSALFVAVRNDRRRSPIAVAPRQDVPANRGGLCQRGWTSADLLCSSERLTTPLRRAHQDAPLRTPDTAAVCQCGNVSKGAIRPCREWGAPTRAGTGCGLERPGLACLRS